MKRWFPLFALVSLLFMWAAGCGGDDLFGNQTTGGSDASTTSDGSFVSDGSIGSDGSTTDGSISDSGNDGSVSDSGEDSAVDAGEDADVDSGFDAGPPDAGPPFNVTSAASTGLTSMTVTFDGLPNSSLATDSANYVVTDGTTTLTLSAGSLDTTTNTVTFTTTTQTATTFTVTVSNVTRDPDGKPLTNDIAMFTGVGAFDVSTAAATTNATVDVTFDAPPESGSAGMPANYAISDGTNPLTVLGASYPGTGNTVTLTTASQTGGTTYTVTVSGVTRASDTQALSNAQATFTGRSSFNVTGAVSNSPTQVTVTFDAAPNGAGNTASNFTIVDGSSNVLAVSAAAVSGSTVVLTTAPQSATSYTVTVANVVRSSDNEPLATNSAGFTGVSEFNVTSASSTSATTVTVTFSDIPDATAIVAGNYAITDGTETLNVSAAILSGPTTVTLTTSNQSAVTYTLTVSNVARAADGLALTNNSTTFTGTDGPQPHVTAVAVASTSPDNGTTAYNTGTATVTITGSNFTGVACPLTGVVLDDQNGAGTKISTPATTCSVDSDTQITATFPAGIRTNGTTGWNVIVTNLAGSNAYSFQKFVPYAGLLVSEVFTGQTGTGNTTHEYVEIYNPTTKQIDATKVDGTNTLRFHVRSSAGGDTSKTLTVINSSSLLIPSHGFLLIISSQSVVGDAWTSHGDYSYSASSSGLTDDGGVYISLASGADSKVLDKVGWGAQPAGGFEGTPITPNIPLGSSVQRKPAGGAGSATDRDVNANDFNTASTTLHHEGTTDAIEPP